MTSLTVDGERRRHAVVPTDEGVLGRVFPAGVHDRKLVQFSLNHNAELLAHLDLHAVFEPGGGHVEVGHFTLKGGHLSLRDLHTLHRFGDAKSCRQEILTTEKVMTIC